MSMKNSSGTIGNWTHDLPACSTVPQPTAHPRVPFPLCCNTLFNITLLPYVSTHSSSCEVCECRFLKISSVAPGNKGEWEEQILKELLRFEVNGVTYALLMWENTANFCRRLKVLKLQMTKWPALFYKRVRWFDVVEVAGVQVEFHCCASNLCLCEKESILYNWVSQ